MNNYTYNPYFDVYSNYLAHYGVKGMKWGVRKRSEKGGSLTRTGVGIFNKHLEDYENKKKNYDSLKAKGSGATDIAINEARLNKKNAKNKLDRAYKQVKKDYSADKGKELFRKGRRISQYRFASGLAGTAGFLYGSSVAQKHGITSVKDLKRNKSAMKSLAIGGAAIAAINAHNAIKINQLNNFYTHSRDVK